MLPRLFALLASAVLAGAAQEQKSVPAPLYPAAKPYKLNWRIDGELTLPDLDGQEHALFAANEGKALVIVFWSYRDPVSLAYAKKLAELQAQHAARATIVLVNPNHDEIVGAGDPLAPMRTVVQKEGITLPVLIDRGNALADDFQAKTNAQAFLVDANHILRYHGGIDDDPRGQKKHKGIAVQQQLGLALETVLKGELPQYNWTIPAGRALKRAPKPAPGAGETPR